MLQLLFNTVDPRGVRAEISTLDAVSQASVGQRPEWEPYWLNIAGAVALRSTCLKLRAGAVLVDKRQRIISTGYNGSYAGAPNCSDVKKCRADATGGGCDVVHAELNALMAGAERAEGATLYVVAFQENGLADASLCEVCFRTAKNAGIARIVHLKADGRAESMKLGWPS